MNPYSKQDYRDAGHGVTFWAFVVGLVVLAGIVIKLFLFPAELVSKTLDADRAIHKYEWFHEAAAQVEAQRGNIATAREMFEQPGSPADRERRMVELTGMQQNCRDLVQRYNAESQKVNSAIFKGMTAPSSISLNACN